MPQTKKLKLKGSTIKRDPKEKAAVKKGSNEVYIIQQGPLRPYVHINEGQLYKWLIMSSSEIIQLILTTSIAIFLRSVQNDKPNAMLLQETKMVSIINGYLTGELFVDYNPPLPGLILTSIARFFGYTNANIDNISVGGAFEFLPYQKLRAFNAILNGLTSLFVYRTLRFTGVSHLISLFGTFLFALENSFIIQSRFILPDSIYIFFLALFLSQHKSVALRTRMSLSWLINVLIASIALGLAISSHWSGIFLLFYALTSLTLRSWSLSGDLDTPRNSLRFSFIFKYISYIVVSITIYLALYKVHFDALTKRGIDYNYLSPEFQYALDGNHLENTNLNTGYGSTVMIRHYDSGKYLHSHNDNYRSSGHQQITLLDTFDDSSNFFEVLPVMGDSEKIIANSTPITSPFRVKFKHTATDSSLVIDPDHKPPLSEQEYNFQVTTDKNFPEEDDKKNRHTFQLRISNKYSKTSHSKIFIDTVNSVFQIYNEKNGCYLLGTPLVLDEGFSSGQNEVICIKEPNYEASLWYFDWNKNPNFPENKETVSFPEFTFWDKLFEISLLNFRKLFIGNMGYDTGFGTTVSDWILLRKGFTHWIDQTSHKNIYLLGNYITYHLVFIAVCFYVLFKACQILTTNPFKTRTSIPLSYNYAYQTFDFILGYGLILTLMLLVKIELHLFEYLPALFIGILMVSQLFQFGFDLFPKLTSIILIVVTVLVLLAYQKYSPLIYGLDWTQEQCLKMLVSPGWDRALCSTYHKA
jgi:dolichyl-phosphate-mannose-protein mannosyltransferase